MNTTAETTIPAQDSPTDSHPGRRPWRHYSVDINLKDEWLEALNSLTVFDLTSICEGHPSKADNAGSKEGHVTLMLRWEFTAATVQYYERRFGVLQQYLGESFRPNSNCVDCDLSTEFRLFERTSHVCRKMFVRFSANRLLRVCRPAPEVEAWFEGVIADARVLDVAFHHLLTEGR